MPDTTLTQVHDRIDELFERDGAVYGRDLKPYRGHVHRVAEMVARQVDMQPDWVEPVAVASYFHDSAIWFDHTWDYLPGSQLRATQELGDDSPWATLVDAMISEHHRVRHARHDHPLVEAMRRADAADVYRVVMPPRVGFADYRDMLRRCPDAGLHLMLGRGFVMGLREHRLNPMPMMKF